MNYFDNELNILEWFKPIPGEKIYVPYENQICLDLYCSLTIEEDFSKWMNSSGKSDPPPDFYNPSMRMMMDVMRIDDHGRIDEKGKVINLINQRESIIQKELREGGFLDHFPNLQSVFVNAVTQLSGKEDHNYDYYLNNFRRTVEKHKRSIPLYRKNHPDYSVVFFVFDESSGYVVAENEEQAQHSFNVGEEFYCRPYLHFDDKQFVKSFVNSDIDYVIWFSPFKHFETNMPELPRACIYDVKRMDLNDFLDYPQTLIMSTEA